MTPDKIITELEDLIEANITAFNKSMPAVQKQAYKEVLNLMSELDKYSDGTVKASGKNVRLIAKIKQRLQEVIIDGSYNKRLKKLLETYDQITKLQNQYFSAMVQQFTVPEVLVELQKQAINITIESLGEQGMNVNVINPVHEILNKNIKKGGKVGDMTEEVRAYLLGDKETEGRLSKHAKQITTDALNQYSANYNKVISDDLGFEWYRYSGSLRKTSREFCVKLIEAKKGCMPYIHKSQLPEIIDGYICGERVAIYKKTGLPQGMIAGTNASNFFVNRGGYSCNHQLTGVPSSFVPKELKDKFK